MKAILPVGFDLAAHLAKYPPCEKYFLNSKFNRDHALYILSQVTLVPVRNKEIADEMKDGLTPLSSVLLQKFVHNYSSYIRYFAETGVLFVRSLYRPNILYPGEGFSRGYRFTDAYSGPEVMVMDYSKKFTKVLARKRDKDLKDLRREYGHLIKWLQDGGLEIDAATARKYLKFRLQAQLVNRSLRDARVHRIFGTEEEKDPQIQYKHAMASVDCFLAGDLGCSVDKTVGRMHTILTNMKSELRHTITYREEKLVSVDVVNSQPYLATIIFKPRALKSIF